jgi:hypothetical protein
MSSSRANGGRLEWLGPGMTAFLLPSRRISARSDRPDPLLLRGPGAAVEAGLDEEACGPLAAFFAWGGRACRGLEVPLAPGRKGAAWLGEDGGPGERSGIHIFRDLEDVGSVVVPPLPRSQLEPFLSLSRRRQELFFILEESPGRGGGSRSQEVQLARPLPNAVIVAPPRGAAGGAALAGWIESRDLAGAGPGRPPSPRGAAPFAAARGALRGLLAWRRWAALSRSIERGSRWIVFEENQALMRRRLEREVRAFIHELSLGGLMPPWGGPGLEVRCEALTEEGDAPGRPSGVRLGVRVRLEEQYARELDVFASRAACEAVESNEKE